MVRQAVFWSFASQIAGFVIQFATAVIVARLLSPHQLGVYAVALAITGIVQLLGTFSVGAYVVREAELTDETVETAYTINSIISVVLAAVIFVTSFFSQTFLGDPDVPQVVRLLALLPLLSIVVFRPSIMLQRAMQARGTSIVSIFSLLLTSAVTIGCAVAGEGSMSPAYGSVTGAVFGSAATMWVGRGHNGFRMSLRSWRPMTAFGLRMLSIGGITTAAVRVGDIVLGHFLGLAALGLFSRASSLSNSIFTNIYGAATRVVFAKLSDAQREGDHVGEVFLRGYRLITAIMAPVLVGLAVLSQPAIVTLYGQKWLGAAVPLSLLLIGQLVSMTYAMNWELFVLRDELKTQTRLEFIRAIVATISRLVSAPINLLAVAAAGVVEPIVSTFLYGRHMPRLARTEPSAFLRAYAEMAALGLLAALPSFALMCVHRWNPSTPLGEIAVAVAAGSVIWLAALIQLRHPLCYEMALACRRMKMTPPRALLSAAGLSPEP